MEEVEFEIRDFLPYLLNQAAEEVSLGFQSIYRTRYGMLRTEWRVLFHLGRYGPMTATEIGTRARIHKTKISRAVSALADRRFLTRETLEDDRRAERLTLTPKGVGVFGDLKRHAQNYDRDLMAQFSKEEGRLLIAALTKLARI